MKQIIALALITLVGCSIPPNGPSGTEYKVKNNNTEPRYDYRVVIIDGCQYIEVDEGTFDSHTYTITHKGNCNNPIHPEHTRQ